MKLGSRTAVVTVVVAAFVGAATAARADFIDHFAKTDDIGTLKVPRAGTTHVLVIPVVVDDLPFEQGSEQAMLDELHAFYAEDATGWGFTPYYTTLSLGRFHPVVTVADPVHFASCPPIGAYANCAIPRGAGLPQGDIQGGIAVLDDAITFIDIVMRCATAGPSAEVNCTSGGGINLADFDTSGPTAGVPDGVADGVILVSNASFPGIALPIRDLTLNPLLQFLGPFPSLTYDDVIVGSVAIAGFESPPQHASFVSVHEFGHLLGWCDLYNENGTTTDMPYTLMGGWFYEDPGSLVDPFSRIAAGFGHVVQVAGPGTFDIGPADTDGTALKIGTGDEFFMVELRRKVDGALDGDLTIPSGVVVERVRLAKRPKPDRGQYVNTISNCVNCTAFDTFLSIEQADGAFDLDDNRGRNDKQDLFQTGSEIAPSDDTAPRSLTHQVFSTNLLDGTPTGIRITVTSADATHAVIDVDTAAVADPCAEIAVYCGDLACTDGECGAVPKPPDPPVPGCGCGAASPMDPTSAFAALAALAALAVLQAPRRRARERR